MTTLLNVRCQRHFRPFDNTDNPCCWQVGPLAAEVDAALLDAGLTATRIDDDWGIGWTWASTDRIQHSLMLECTDIDNASYRFSSFAYRRFLVFWTRRAPDDESDFRWLRPILERLGDAT
jgi:hypothetical protein